MKYLSLSLSLLFFLSNSASARNVTKIDPGLSLKVELNAVLKDASQLHQASYKRSEREVESSIGKLLQSIDRARKKSKKEREQGIHLNRMLRSAQDSLSLSRRQLGEKRRESLKEAFSQIVQITQVYKLETYPVFFCPKDKAIWLQKSRKAQNPINPERYGDCGKLVN